VKAKKYPFDPKNVEMDYELDLNSPKQRMFLQYLIDLDEKITSQSLPGEEQVKGDCFGKAKLGKAAWTAPTSRNKFGFWDIGEPQGILKFTFAL